MLVSLSLTVLAGVVPTVLVGALCLAFLRHPTVRAMALPLLVAVFAAGVAVANFLDVGDVAAGQVMVRVAVWFLIVVLVLRALLFYTFRVLLERQWQIRLPPMLPRVALAFLYFVAALIIVSVAYPGARVGPLLATSAVTSLVLGLALQPILTNFFAGVVIALERPFRIDDWIHVDDHEGRVTSITWRTTSIRTRQNDTVIFPNASVAGATVVNFLYPHPLHMARIYVGVHYRTPPHRVRAALHNAATRVNGILDRPSVEVYVHGFDSSAVTYELRAWIRDMAALRRVESEARQEIWEEFRRQNITIPFPIRTLEIARPPRPAETDVPAARLFVSAGAARGRSTEIVEGRAIVGRSKECDLYVADPSASSQHAEVTWEDGTFRLRDLGSTHGTRVNGEEVTEIDLVDLDRFEIGDTMIVIEIDG